MKRIGYFSYVYGSFEIFDDTNLLFFICPNSHLEKCHFRWNRPNRSRIPTKHEDIWQTLWKKRLFGQPKRLISTCFLKLYETARNTVIYGGLPNIEQVHPQIWTRLRSGKWRTREHLTNTRKTTTFLATGAPQVLHIPTVSRFLANFKKHGDIWRSAQKRTVAHADMSLFALWKVKNTRASDKHSENNDFSSNRSASSPPYTNRFAFSCEQHAFF